MAQPPSIRVLAPVMLLLPAVVVAMLILLITSRAARQTATEQAFHELELIQSTVANRVDELLAAPRRAVSLNSRLLNEGKLDPNDPAAWRETLLAESRAFPMLSAITWALSKGPPPGLPDMVAMM